MALDGVSDRAFTRKAMQTEMLDADTELALAYAWRDQRDHDALHRLVTAYMRLAISMASKYRRYGAPMNDLIQEASLGLMKAAEKFDPDRGVRFSTYAVWWIKASIQDFVMRNWSMVRTGTTTSQKSLFFNLRRVEAEIERTAAKDGRSLSSDEKRRLIAEELGVPEHDVATMLGRLSGGDRSLNAPQGGDEEGREWIETIEDEGEQSAETVAADLDRAQLREWLMLALAGLSERERLIVQERKLRDDPRTLESLGDELGLSKERVRQLEAAAFTKMRRKLQTEAPEAAALLV